MPSNTCSRQSILLYALQYPLLAGHYSRVEGTPGIKQYRLSNRCVDKQNGNGLG